MAALLGPDPRVIADGVWAKLLWAGLNLETADLPEAQAGHFYPFELVRALTLTWLFSGQRSDEIARLRVGCIRWQHDGAPIAGDSPRVLARDAVCLLDVPAHKTGTAFTKPVDPILGQAIEAWQTARPGQPQLTDRRTGDRAEPAAHLPRPTASRPATSTTRDDPDALPQSAASRPLTCLAGDVTSHQARRAIAGPLYNAEGPMTLFELQAWLGHRLAAMTQIYAKV